MKIKRVISALILVTALVLNSASTARAATYDLTVTVVGMGTVNSDPVGINDCTTSCTSPFTDTPVVLTATSTTGYVFSGWSGDVSCPGTGTCNIPIMTGNTNETATFTADSDPPTVFLDSTTPNLTNVSSIPVTVHFSEPVTGFDQSDINFTPHGGTVSISDFHVDSSTDYTFNLVTTADGIVTVDIPKNAAKDLAGNDNLASNLLARTVDTTRPTFTPVTPATNAFINSVTSASDVSYDLSETLASGTILVTHTGGTSDGDHTCNLTGAALTSGLHAPFNMSTGCEVAPTLVSGAVYTFAFSGTDLAGNSAFPVSSANVTFDTSQATFTPIAPVTGAFINNISSASDVSYDLSETLAIGTILITHTSGTSDGNHTCNLTGAALSGGAHTAFNMNTGCAVAPTLVSGAVYTFAFSGTDPAGNAAISASSANVTFDTSQATFTPVTPATGAFINNISSASDVSYDLSETLASGSIEMTWTGGTSDGNHTCNLTSTAMTSGVHTAFNMNTGCAVAPTLVSGAVYTFAFSGTDAAGNTAIPASSTGVTFDTSQATFTPVTPITGAFINNISTASDVSYNLSETLASGTIVMTWAGGTSDGDHTCNLTGAALSGGAHAPFNMSTGCTVAPTLISGAIYTFTFSGTDAAGNAAIPVISTNVTFDNTQPVFSAVTPLSNAFINSISVASDVSYTLNKSIASGSIVMTWTGGTSDVSHTCTLVGSALASGSHTAFNMSDITNGCASPAPTLVSGAIYTFTFSGTDVAGNPAAPISSTRVTFDTISPTMTFTLQPGSDSGIFPTDNITNKFSLVFDAAFNEAITGFIPSDLTFTGSVTGCTFAIGPTSTNTYPVTASACSEGKLTVRLIAGSVTDLAGNPVAQTDSPEITIDRTGPSVSMDSSIPPGSTGVSPIPVTVTFVEPVVDFTAAGITPTNATIGGFTGSGMAYSFNLFPSVNGNVSADIPAGVAHDVAGNANSAAPTFTRVYDSVRPTVSISSTAPLATNVSPIPVTVTFSKPVTGLLKAEIIVTNGTFASLNGSGAVYTFDLVPSAQGTVTVNIAANVAQDAGGNWNTAAATFSRTFDTLHPLISWVSPVTSGNIYTVYNQIVHLEVNASDNIGVARVVFSRYNYQTGLDVVLGTIYAAPYSLDFDTTPLLPNANEIDADVYDTAGNWWVSYIFLSDIPSLMVNKSGSGSGIVTSTPSGINCGSTCIYGYSGTLVTLTATPIAPAVFGGWSGACTGKGPCQLTMTGDKSVTANFDVPFKIFLPFLRK